MFTYTTKHVAGNLDKDRVKNFIIEIYQRLSEVIIVQGSINHKTSKYSHSSADNIFKNCN